jgi:hypothetical protein
MSNYFSYFPKENYKGKIIRDITKRTNFIQKNLSDPLLFLPYTVTEDDKPEDIAHYYYGSVDYTWIVLLVNNVIDPYNDWVLNENQLRKFIEKKYRNETSNSDVYSWAQNQTILDNILYFEREENTYNVETVLIESIVNDNEFILMDTKEGRQQLYENNVDLLVNTPIRVYDYEYLVNENKRQILLVDKKYITKIEEEFYRLMKE